jgi:C2H2 type zinc finger protein
MAPPRQGTSSRKRSVAAKASNGATAQKAEATAKKTEAAAKKTEAAAKKPEAAAKKTEATATNLVCPECGRTFTRAAALGAHRRRAHGVAGQSAQARRSRQVRQSARASSLGRRARSTPAAPRQRTRNDGDGSVDRDALLKAIFPGGLPAREDVIRAVTGWLDDAERLARMR